MRVSPLLVRAFPPGEGEGCLFILVVEVVEPMGLYAFHRGWLIIGEQWMEVAEFESTSPCILVNTFFNYMITKRNPCHSVSAQSSY